MAKQSTKISEAGTRGTRIGKQEDGELNNDDELSVYESVVEITRRRARSTPKDEEALLLKLRSWWSTYYQRPLKDPILDSYTLEELLYEYHDKIEREKAEELRTDKEADKIEEERQKVNLDWAEEEELREIEELKKQQEAKNTDDVAKISKSDEKWMEEQLKKDKEAFGEDFGEDLDVNFEE